MKTRYNSFIKILDVLEYSVCLFSLDKSNIKTVYVSENNIVKLKVNF